MLGVNNYEQVSGVYSVVADPYLPFVLHVMLFHNCNMFCTFTLVLYEIRVQGPKWLFFCSFLISFFSSIMLRYYLNDFQMVPVVPIIMMVIIII
jgi:hypothetical protein